MKAQISLAIAAFCASITAFAAPARPQPIRATPGSPTEAVELLAAAAQRKDVEAFQSHLGGRARADFEAGRARDAWDAALDVQFGNDNEQATVTRTSDKMAMFADRTFQVWSVKDTEAARAELTVWVIPNRPGGTSDIREETWCAIKDGKRWLLIPSDRGYVDDAFRKDAHNQRVRVTVVSGGTPNAKESLQEELRSKAMAEACLQLIVDVRAGKFPDRRQAWRALIDRAWGEKKDAQKN